MSQKTDRNAHMVGTTFLHKGFSVTRLDGGRYQVTTPSGQKLAKVLTSPQGVSDFVYDYRNTEVKDRCEECSAPSKGPLMVRDDVYHRVCHECARSNWPQWWAFFRAHGWYPSTEAELRSNVLDQQSATKLWDGTPRPKWVAKALAGRAV